MNYEQTTIPATFVSHKRAQRAVYPTTALLRIHGVASRAAAQAFLGNGVASVYTIGGEQKTNYGRVCRVHGNSGVVTAKFRRNLPPQKIGTEVFVQLYKVPEDDY